MLAILPTAIEPPQWVLAFHRSAARRWTGWLACGRYKHVSAFAYLPEIGLWLWFDVCLDGTHLVALPDSEAGRREIAVWTADADYLRVPRRPARRVILAPFYCVAAVRHLVGVPGGALRPDGLWRDCLRNGGELVTIEAMDGAGTPSTDHRPRDIAVAARGA